MQHELKRFHFVGIGGIGMAALAEWLRAAGSTVTGSDLHPSPQTERLETLGVSVRIGHAASALGDAEVVVHSSAITEDNPELAAARAAGLPIVSRGALLADILRTRRGIAIGGTHGKTTTSAMVAHLLRAAGLSPTALIGGRVPQTDGSRGPTWIGESDLFVAEVDESDGSFLLTRPAYALLTNAEPEHLDHYGDRDQLFEAFVEFGNSVPFWGRTILCIDDPGLREIEPRIAKPKRFYGLDPRADLRALGIESQGTGSRVVARFRDEPEFEFQLPVPGEHNVRNALGAMLLARTLGIDWPVLTRALAGFGGVARRFEAKGEVAGIRVVDDYAHHPTEIEATLRAARGAHSGRIVAVFQPHRFSRTRDLFEGFARAFGDADCVVISEIYAASEAAIPGIDGAALARALGEAGHPDARYGGDLDAIAEALPRQLGSGDLVLTLGAGDIVSLGPRLLEALGHGVNETGGHAS